MSHFRSNIQSQKLTAKVKATGCAAKINSCELSEMIQALSRLACPQLLAGIDNFEDAAVYKIADDLAIIETVDFFPPPVDDPVLFGRIAATNALSDVYAMGGRPILAQNIFCFPTCEYSLAIAKEILAGGARAVAESGAVLAGGHSINGLEPIYGLAVTGIVHPERILTNCGAKEGDILVLCKPVGTGVGLLGLKGDMLSSTALKELLDSLTTLNKDALAIILKYCVHALTDVTGFGLIGHVHEMSQASRLKVELWADKVVLLPETLSLAEQGFVPAAAYANRKSYEKHVYFDVQVDIALSDLLFDPQTAGGLLAAVAPLQAEAVVKDLQDAGLKASAIGVLRDGQPGQVEVMLNAHTS
ncbi:MAG: selenide, water dikinase SelD [Candidatus Melainabacteria bacterium]|nr:selenide, water dikinase SelD [Candidatus Melainabacteria bacterium]